jgi:hypothetical protein
VILLRVASALAVSADWQRRRLQAQERVATSQALAAQADATTDSRPDHFDPVGPTGIQRGRHRVGAG